jgi:hypothetical protein
MRKRLLLSYTVAVIFGVITSQVMKENIWLGLPVFVTGIAYYFCGFYQGLD